MRQMFSDRFQDPQKFELRLRLVAVVTFILIELYLMKILIATDTASSTRHNSYGPLICTENNRFTRACLWISF